MPLRGLLVSGRLRRTRSTATRFTGQADIDGHLAVTLGRVEHLLAPVGQVVGLLDEGLGISPRIDGATRLGAAAVRSLTITP